MKKPRPANLRCKVLDVKIPDDFDSYNMAITQDCSKVAIILKNQTFLYNVHSEDPSEDMKTPFRRIEKSMLLDKDFSYGVTEEENQGVKYICLYQLKNNVEMKLMRKSMMAH